MRDYDTLRQFGAASTAERLTRAGVDKTLLHDLAAAGALDLASLLGRYMAEPTDLADAAAGFAQNGPDRRVVYEELGRMLYRESPRPHVLLRVIMLAEMLGRVFDLRAGLTMALSMVDAVPTQPIDAFSTPGLNGLGEAARTLHDLDAMESKALAGVQSRSGHTNADLAAAYRSLFAALDLDAAQPGRLVRALAAGETIRLSRPTAVIRLSSRFFRSLERAVGARPKPIDGLMFLPAVRSFDLDVAVIPQFSNPGPHYAAPFALDDPNFICSFGVHKFSNAPHPKLMHHRDYVRGRYLLDHGGYSGWLRLPPLDQMLDTAEASGAQDFCDKERAEQFDGVWPADVPNDRPFVFIALQLEGDSVRDLSYGDPATMIRVCYDHFSRMGWNVVIKRHPKDRYIGMEQLVAQAATLPNVVISVEPSTRLVAASGAVAVVNSSVGWEAVLAAKPLLAFGRAEYAPVAQEVRSETDLERLSLAPDAARRAACDAAYAHFFQQIALLDRGQIVDRARDEIAALLKGETPPGMLRYPDC